MTIKRNSLAGITSGTNITNVNQTGGASGDQFDTLSLSANTSLQVNTSAKGANVHANGLICNINGQLNAEAMLGWNFTSGTDIVFCFYYKVPADNVPNTNARLMRAYGGGTQRWEMRHILTTGNLGIMEFVGGTTIIQTDATTGVLAANTIYRVEGRIRPQDTDCTLAVYVGEQTSAPMAVQRFGNAIGAGLAWDNIRFGIAGTGTAPDWSPNLSGFAASNEGALLGPATVTGVTFSRHLIIG